MNGTSLAKLPSQSMRLTSVVTAHDRLGGHDPLAVEAHDDPQRAVRCGVLRTDVEGHALGLEFDVDPGVGGLGGDVRELLRVGDVGHSSSPPSAPSPDESASSSLSSPGISSTSTMPGQGLMRRASSG